VDVQKKLDDIVAAVAGARAMPMSASCVINRAELLALLEEVREALPGSLAQAQELLGGSEQLVEQARQEAELIIESAHAERGSLVSGTEVVQRSQAEADRILADARQEADEIRAEADDYVDSKLANFEVVLTKTLGSVGRGREKLLGTGPGLDQDGYEDPDYAEAPERSQDPDTLREHADTYVDVKLGAFEAVLAKTLEAVGRGRQKLHGMVASDELGALADSDPGKQHTSDADFLADLADPSAGAAGPRIPEQPRVPQQAVAAALLAEQQSTAVQRAVAQLAEQQAAAAAQQPYPVQAPDQGAAYAQDPYGYQQDGYAQQDPYQQHGYTPTVGYAPEQDASVQGAYTQQQDLYAYPQQQDPYGYQQGYDPTQTAAAGSYDELQGQAHAALDETSFFDTSLISAEQLRQYEQQRQYGQGR
jgi:cell division septum initiation protein DivIVA